MFDSCVVVSSRGDFEVSLWKYISGRERERERCIHVYIHKRRKVFIKYELLCLQK